jgi:hypothetical protein
MRVNKKEAAALVGKARSTFYKDLKSRSISVNPDGSVDVSELIRVYGNENVMSVEQRELSRNTAVEQGGTAREATLAADLRRLQEQLETMTAERRRERDQLNEHIAHLKENLDKSLEQNSNLARLLTDERTNAEKLSLQKKTEQEEKLEEVLKSVRKLEEGRKSGWRLFRKRALPERTAAG